MAMGNYTTGNYAGAVGTLPAPLIQFNVIA
jgi:hypothetical protein